MAQRFFKLSDDRYVPHRWHLDTPIASQGRKVHDRDFTRGTPVQVDGRLKIPIEIAGRRLDFTWAGLSIPVVHVKVASMLAERAPGDVQLIPADIEGQPEQYVVLKVGQYMGVDRLRVDKAKAGNAKVFRPEGWSTALIVSGEIKDAMDAMGATGTRFQEV